MKYILHAQYIGLARDAMVVVNLRCMKVSLLILGSFEPLAPKPEVAQQLAKGTKEKTQTQGDEEHGEREDEKRRDAAPFISPDRGPCCAT